MPSIIKTLRKQSKRLYSKLRYVLRKVRKLSYKTRRLLYKVRRLAPSTRRQKRQWIRIGGVVALLVVGTLAYNKVTVTTIDPAAYATLLETIAKGESNGNYNAYFGNAKNMTIRFTEMSVAEVLQWQADYVAQGSVSSAVGKYQIIRPTLAGLVKELKLDTSKKFDKTLQDKMAMRLIERRGAIQFVDSKLSRDDFAANLSKEWAALPRVTGANPGESHYAGDGVNKARISVSEVFTAIDKLKM